MSGNTVVSISILLENFGNKTFYELQKHTIRSIAVQFFLLMKKITKKIRSLRSLLTSYDAGIVVENFSKHGVNLCDALEFLVKCLHTGR